MKDDNIEEMSKLPTAQCLATHPTSRLDNNYYKCLLFTRFSCFVKNNKGSKYVVPCTFKTTILYLQWKHFFFFLNHLNEYFFTQFFYQQLFVSFKNIFFFVFCIQTICYGYVNLKYRCVGNACSINSIVITKWRLTADD